MAVGVLSKLGSVVREEAGQLIREIIDYGQRTIIDEHGHDPLLLAERLG